MRTKLAAILVTAIAALIALAFGLNVLLQQNSQRIPSAPSSPYSTPTVAPGQMEAGSDKPVSRTTQVTLGVFSGRPNPSWTLTPAQDAELRQRLDALLALISPSRMMR